MQRHTRRRIAALTLVAGAGVIGLAGTVSAHVSIAEGEVTAGAYEILTLSVPHGCGGSPTTEVRIQIPESIPTPTPTVHAGWDAEKVMETLATAVDAGHGTTIEERVAEVVYTAQTPLPDGFRDAFELSVKIPDDAAGETLYFPTVQTCEQGETRWIEIPAEGQDPHDLESPAPSVAVVAAAAGGGHGDGVDALTWVALAVGVVGLGLGGAALAVARTR